MKKQIFTATLWTLLGNGGQQLVGFLLFLYLTRQLRVEDFGLMGLASAIIDILALFGRFGQVESLQQRDVVTQTLASTSFWLLQAIGLCCMIVICASSKPLAFALHEPKLQYILLALSPVCLLSNLGQVHEALIKRELKYKLIARRSILSSTLSALFSFIAAYWGLGVYSLVLQRLIYNLAYSTTLLFSYRWRPSIRVDYTEARTLASTGLDISASNTISSLNLRIVDFLVGSILGVSALGYLRVAWRFFDFVSQLIIQPISSVYLATLSTIQGNATSLKRAYIRFFQLLSLIAVPTFLGLGAVAHSFVEVVFGSQWLPSVSIFRLLSIASLSVPIGFLFPPTMIILRRTGAVRSQAIWQAIATTGFTFAAAHISMNAVIIMHCIRALGFAAFNGWTLGKLLEIRVATMRRLFFPPLVSSIVMLTIVYFAEGLMGKLPPIAALGISTITGATSFLLAIGCGDLVGFWSGYTRNIATFIRDTVA